tara:strand:+ start:385 stop:747 length:363 start_codon:yes stop_codon:yes gene_type:complete
MAQRIQKGLQTYTVQEAQNAALGQLGSFIIQNASTVTLPGGERCIVAITALTDCQFAQLVSVKDKYDGGTNWVGTGEAGWGNLGGALVSTIEIPRGVTIYGRWNVAQLNSANMRCICYMG